MVYADTDFFIALIKPEDWLKESAKTIYQSYKGRIWTSVSTVAEIFLICHEFNFDPVEITVALFSIADVKGIERETAIAAAHFMRDHNLTPFDALHAAYCDKDIIVSSDGIYDKIGFERIKLEKKQKS